MVSTLPLPIEPTRTVNYGTVSFEDPYTFASQSVSWGATPTGDQLVANVRLNDTVQLLTTAGVTLGAIITAQASPLYGGLGGLAYDPYRNSFVGQHSGSTHNGEILAFRLDFSGRVLSTLTAPLVSGQGPSPGTGVAVDGLGHTVLNAITPSGANQLFFYTNDTFVWSTDIPYEYYVYGLSYQVAIDPSTSLIYSPDMDNSIIHRFNYAGVELQPLNISAADAALIAPANNPEGSFFYATLIPPSLGGPSLLVPSAVGSALFTVDTVTGHVAPFLNFSFLTDGLDFLNQCLLDPRLTVLYCVVLRFEGYTSYFLPAFAAEVDTGRILVEYANLTEEDEGLKGVFALTPDGELWTSTTDGLVFYPPLPTSLLPPPVSTASSSTGSSAPFASISNGSLCLLFYSLPGDVDYPWSTSLSTSLQFSPQLVSTPLGSAVNVLSGTGTRIFTNRFGATISTPFTIAVAGSMSSNNLLYLGSAYPLDGSGLTLNFSSPIQLPGLGPTELYSLINVHNFSGLIVEGAVREGR